MSLQKTTLYILAFFFFLLQSCTSQTSQSTEENATQETSSEELQSENSEAIAAMTEEMENGEMQQILTCEGTAGIELGGDIAVLKESFRPEQLELLTEQMDGDQYKVKIQKGIEVLVSYSDKGNGTTIDMIETVTETDKLKFGDFYVGMTLQQFNQAVGKPVICTYSEEVSQTGVGRGDIPNFPCLYVSFNIRNGGNIGDKLPASLKKKGTFMSNDPELLKLNPYIYGMYVAKVD